MRKCPYINPGLRGIPFRPPGLIRRDGVKPSRETHQGLSPRWQAWQFGSPA